MFMKTYAIIKIGSRQLTIHSGDSFSVERQATPVNFDVLFYSDGEKILVGAPVLKEVAVKLVLEGEGKIKTSVGRFKSKSRYRKNNGHKQPTSLFKVESINLGSAKAESAKSEKATEEAVKVETKKTETKKAATPKKTTSTVKKPASKKLKEDKK